MTEDRRPLALVTGASAGIGMAYAERLARDGCNLIISGRRSERLADLAARLRTECGAEVESVVADLGTEAGLGEIDELCRHRELDMLVNNAGLAHYMPFLDLPEHDLQALVKVDALAPNVHTHSAARGMVVQHPSGMPVHGAPFKVSDHAPALTSPAPRQGEHTIEILRELGR